MCCADSKGGRDPKEFEIFFEKIEKLCSGSRLFRSVPVHYVRLVRACVSVSGL
jgi:hypothetical protein